MHCSIAMENIGIRLMFVICYMYSTCNCFYFKQKTAYEMRISDWSSDVCSSDLLEHIVVALRGHRPILNRNSMQRTPAAADHLLCDTSANWRGAPEIGRASCRARGCQYV